MSEPVGSGSLQPRGYPHLAPELQALSGGVLQFWGDADERSRAVEAILSGSEQSDSVLGAALGQVDVAVAQGLAAVGLPRGPVRGVQLEAAPTAWAGRKDPDCTLYVSLSAIRLAVEARRPDAVVRTWVHESLHARQPYSASYRSEYVPFRGYEEGLVEGLARLVTCDWAGMSAAGGTFEYYVTAYRSLAAATGASVDVLWRSLWRLRPGEVRAALPLVVDEVYRQASGSSLSIGRLARLRGVADAAFATGRAAQVPDAIELARTWRTVFR